MFDIGFTELLLLSLVGLLVLGPERLPKVARTLGGLARRARGSWLSLKRSIEAEMRAEELREPLQRFQNEARGAVDGLKQGIDAVRDFQAERKAPVAAEPAASDAKPAASDAKPAASDAKPAASEPAKKAGDTDA
jgi:sec-independent protein translocase protein TatB